MQAMIGRREDSMGLTDQTAGTRITIGGPSN